MTADQLRQAAIEAGTEAARHKLGTLWPEPMLTAVAREMVVAVIDAAAPHLVGELLGAIRNELDHAAANGHHLDPRCQGVDFRYAPPPAVRVDHIEAAIEGVLHPPVDKR